MISKIYGDNFNPIDRLKKIKEYKFTGTETYVHWNKIEPEYGKFDWSVYDPEVERLLEAGLKWMPFILMGPRYSAPDWRLASPDFVPLKCIEHDKECPIESIWNPKFKEHITRVLKAIQEHYGPTGVLESVMPGICGDYGEAIYVCHGNWPGAYHGHFGYWCGDSLAIEDYQNYLKEKYKTINALNDAHWSKYNDFSEIKTKLQNKATNRQAILDQMIWYKKSMTDYADFWMSTVKEIFDQNVTPYLCTGGCEQAYLGADFAAQARICAKNSSGIRLTNETNKFYQNFLDTIHGWSACKFYGAKFALEPVGTISKRGFRERLFGTMAYGNEQFHTYGIFDKDINMVYEDKDWDFFNENMKPHEKYKTIGVFYPTYMSAFSDTIPTKFNEALAMLRHHFPVSVVCETMILDGALDSLDTLFILDADFTSKDVILKIVDWAKNRGKQLFTNTAITDIFGDPVPEFNALFGINENSEKAHGHITHKFNNIEGFENVNKFKDYPVEVSYKNLDLDTTIIAYHGGTAETGETIFGLDQPLTASLFMKKINNCKCIMYSGWRDIVIDPEKAYGTSNGAYAEILKDVAKQDGVPFYELKEGEVAKAEYFGKTLVLTETEIKFED